MVVGGDRLVSGVDGVDMVESGVVGGDWVSDESVVMMMFLEGSKNKCRLLSERQWILVFDRRGLTCYNRKNRREKTRILLFGSRIAIGKAIKDTKVERRGRGYT
jgi:hypothetical protein